MRSFFYGLDVEDTSVVLRPPAGETQNRRRRTASLLFSPLTLHHSLNSRPPSARRRKSLPCARGGGTSSQTGVGRVVVYRSLTTSQSNLNLQVTIPQPQAAAPFAQGGLRQCLFRFPTPVSAVAVLPPLKGRWLARSARRRGVLPSRPQTACLPLWGRWPEGPERVRNLSRCGALVIPSQPQFESWGSSPRGRAKPAWRGREPWTAVCGRRSFPITRYRISPKHTKKPYRKFRYGFSFSIFTWRPRSAVRWTG